MKRLYALSADSGRCVPWCSLPHLLLSLSFALTLPGAAVAQSGARSGVVAPPPGQTAANRPNDAPASTPAAVSATPDHTPALRNAPLQPPPAGFNAEAVSRDVLSHLSAVVRYFRMAVTPIQTVGEPSDLLYREQALNQATQAANLAFDSAKAEATLLANYEKLAGRSTTPASEGEAQKLQTVRANVAQRLADLKAQEAATDAQMTHAKSSQRDQIAQQKEQIEGAIELNTAMNESLGKIVSLTGSQANAGLAADIDRLQRSTPELAASTSKTVVAPPLASLSSAQSAGVSSQAVVLFRLLATRRSIDDWVTESDALHAQAMKLRVPLTTVVRSLVQSGQALSQKAQNGDLSAAGGQSPPATTANGKAPPEPAMEVARGAAGPANSGTQASGSETPAQTRRRFDSVTNSFELVSSAIVPLSQEIILLEQSRANLLAWRSAVNVEYTGVLRSLLLRVFFIALALGIILGLGELWRRATMRYVHDIRRRRQLLVMRRIVIGFLSGLVVLLGFVSQFNSLATFAGFITAGLAVGLQTILLSVAAYFFIVGRYGVRVGDRITVAGVTGDVIDVGLVRFYMLELAGSGTELQPTGRVAVFSNSVLFQAGTPLYKQMPGTEYAWHELTVKLAQASNYGDASQRLLHAVKTVYEDYRPQIEQQYREVQSWMDSPIDAPEIASRLQLVDGNLQLTVRYPVELREASTVDQRITESLLGLMADDPEVKTAVTATPAIRSIVKG